MEDFVYLATYPVRTEAETVKGLLEANSIKCFLQLNENGDALMGAFAMTEGPTDLWVLPKDLDKARELISPEPTI